MNEKIDVMASEFIGACRSVGNKKFLEQMRELHRTQQQMFAGLVFAWLDDYAGYLTDDRNRASVEFTRELRELYCDATGKEGFPEWFRVI